MMDKTSPINDVVFGSDKPIGFTLEGLKEGETLCDAFVQAKAYVGPVSCEFAPEDVTMLTPKDEIILPVQTSLLAKGDLYIDVVVKFPDDRFKAGYRNEIHTVFTNIRIV